LSCALSVTRARMGLKIDAAFSATVVENEPFGCNVTGVPFTVSDACAIGMLLTKPVTLTELACVKTPCEGVLIVTLKAAHVLGWPLQMYPGSTVHEPLHPSPRSVSWSSHCSA